MFRAIWIRSSWEKKTVNKDHGRSMIRPGSRRNTSAKPGERFKAAKIMTFTSSKAQAAGVLKIRFAVTAIPPKILDIRRILCFKLTSGEPEENLVKVASLGVHHLPSASLFNAAQLSEHSSGSEVSFQDTAVILVQSSLIKGVTQDNQHRSSAISLPL